MRCLCSGYQNTGVAGVDNHNILSEFDAWKQPETVSLSGVSFRADGAATSLNACQRMNFPI
ncbi:hypothetical protein AWB69_01411 [Caballeronia udeis]|uniref:Uncharacterized protein n=1 Tax=Caballeronia udeis TaxID=1232866 RepID=A0A158FN44_9BURK|nr:hypothetical protein AWB69_01411 [Caballeronia udeis]